MNKDEAPASPKDAALRLALEVLENNKRTHHYCEDTWYSCPKHEDGCANDAEGDECNCGADKTNAEIDAVITAIKQVLAQPEPVAYVTDNYSRDGVNDEISAYLLVGTKLYTSPPKREPLTNGEIYTAYITATNQTLRAQDERLAFAFARAIEAAHGIFANAQNKGEA